MQVDWDWIFQRPHIFAKFLEEDYECYTVYPKSLINRESVVKKNVPAKYGKPAYKVPLQSRFGFIKKLNDVIEKCVIGNLSQYDAIWVCHPSLMKYISDNYQGKIIYDCMDNHVAMEVPNAKSDLAREEEKLIKRADLILVSSNYLKELVGQDEKTLLIRNGYKEAYQYPVDEARLKDNYKVGYFGTVAEWFDFNLLEKNIEQNENINRSRTNL